MRVDCAHCKYSIMDYADGYGGGYWFPAECQKELEMDIEDCEEFEEITEINDIG